MVRCLSATKLSRAASQSSSSELLRGRQDRHKRFASLAEGGKCSTGSELGSGIVRCRHPTALDAVNPCGVLEVAAETGFTGLQRRGS